MKKSPKKRIAMAAIAIAAAMWCFSGRSDSWLRSRVVKISSPMGMCSGEQVRAPSGVDYILTAGHCKGLAPDDIATVTDAEGHTIDRMVIAEDPNQDLLLIQGLPNMHGLDIASGFSFAEHVRTFTHGHDMDTYETEGTVIEKKHLDIPVGEASDCPQEPKYRVVDFNTILGPLPVCCLSVDEIATNAGIIPGSSGGMVVNSSGELVGVAAASDGYFGYFISIYDVQKFLSGY